MPDESVEAALAALEEEQRRLDGFTDFLDSDFTVVQSENHMVTVELDGCGEVLDIEFDGVKYRELADAELGRMLVETIRAGRTQCLRKLAEVVGDDVIPGFAEPPAPPVVVAREIPDELADPVPNTGIRAGVLNQSSAPEEEVPQAFAKRSSLVVQADDDDVWQSGQSSAVNW